MRVRVSADFQMPDDWIPKVKQYPSERFSKDLTDDEAYGILRDLMQELFEEEVATEEGGIFVSNVVLERL